MTAQRTPLSRDHRNQPVAASSPVSDHRGWYPDGDRPPGGHARLDLPSLRLLRVPDVAPPFDGEILPSATRAAPGMGTPPVTYGLPAATAVVPGPAAGTGHAAARGNRAADCDDWTRQFARILVETLAGARPPRQLLPWLTDSARAHLRRIAPIFGCGQRPRVLRVLASRPADGVAELSVIVGLGPRARALAVRLEEAARADRPSRWLCTDIEAA